MLNFITSIADSSKHRNHAEVRKNRRKACLGVEGMEGRQLMTAAPAIDVSHMQPAAAQVVMHPATTTVIDGSLNGATLGTLNSAVGASYSANVLQIGEAPSFVGNAFPQQFPYYITVGTELMKVTGYSGSITLNNALANNFPLAVQRDVMGRGPQAHSVHDAIVYYGENPPLTGTVGTPPSAPGGVSATAVSSSQINISWSPVSGASGYALYSWNGSKFVQFETTSGTSFSATGLNSNTTYYFTVAAYNQNGTSLESAYASATTKLAMPAAPTGLTVREISKTQVLLTWNADANTANYNMYDYVNGQWVKFYAPTTTYLYVNVAAGSRYYFEVTASNSAGSSAGSSYVSIATS